MIVFTICSRNFTGYAETLRSSLAEHYPDLRFHLVLCDEIGDFDAASLPFPVIEMTRLGIPDLEEMQQRYNITELNTALKPFAFMYLFEKFPGQPVVYIDPDIMALSRFEELDALFAQGADCVLTPHITESAEFAELHDQKFLMYGVYNLGFCALRDTPETRRVVAWWQRRLRRDCVIDLEHGIFVDQKWADLLPAFIQNTRILRHPGYNVAYWNLAQRRLAHDGERWLANGLPIRFFHFSGNKIEDREVFTRHAGTFTPKNTPLLAGLLDEYRERVFRSGHAYYASINYAFNWEGISRKNEHTPKDVAMGRGDASTRPHLPALRSASFEAFVASRENNSENARRRTEIEIAALPAENKPFVLDGYCVVCDGERSFITNPMNPSRTLPDGRAVPNWREHLACTACGTSNRYRGSLHILQQEFAPPADARVYVTERVTAFYNILAQRWPRIVGSEFFSPDVEPGTVRDGVQHEDIQNLTFADQSFDLILSFDVLEHVPFVDRAFKETFRCLAPGGRLFFTAPFSFDHAEEVTRCVMRADGSIEHFMEPEIHGNPVDPEGGALCFRYFGWSVLDQLREAGFEDAMAITFWSQRMLHFGGLQSVITARRPKVDGAS